MDQFRIPPGHFHLATQSPQETFREVLNLLVTNGIHINRNTAVEVYEVIMASYQAVTITFNAPPAHAQPPPVVDIQNTMSSTSFSTVPTTAKKTYEYPGLPKYGAPRDCNTSFYWSHEDPTFAVMLPDVDLTVYPNSSMSMKDAGEKAAEVCATNICAIKMAETDILKQDIGHLAPVPASEANTSPTVEADNSDAESHVSGDTETSVLSIPTTGHALDGTQATSTQETSTQDDVIFSQSHESLPSTQDTVYTVDSAQSSQPANGSRPADAATRTKKTPVSAAHTRRSSPLAQSEPMVPEDVTLGKRSRDDDTSEPKPANKKSKGDL
ncbi:hypothetical protein L13192_10024 [Pyrenophora tritici-repentis]|nr:hypothetical protein L13192_10024 [Pyrenophora tritici-repentis]KAI1679349.1 hypothetical protein KJE20_11531 [Pyrenophora tritici-repentis]PWO24737.1 RNA12 multi-domain protein [Pyrenophora tritici-repentis]